MRVTAMPPAPCVGKRDASTPATIQPAVPPPTTTTFRTGCNSNRVGTVRLGAGRRGDTAQQPVLASDETRHMGDRCHLKVHPFEKLAIAQLRQLYGRQRLQSSGGYPVKTLQFGLAAVDKLDVDAHRFDQVELSQPAGERVAFLRSRDQGREYRRDALQEFCRLAVLEKQAFTFLRLNGLTAQVNRHIERGGLSFRIVRAARDQRERLPLNLQRHIGGIPSTAHEEQVFLTLEPQQRGRLESTGFGVLREEDRIMRQESGKLPRDHAHGVDFGALTRGPRGRNAHVPVSLIVENY